jgi:hypothetical protein
MSEAPERGASAEVEPVAEDPTPAAAERTEVDALWSRVDAPAPERVAAAGIPALRAAKVVRLQGRAATLLVGADEVAAKLAPDVDPELVALAIKNGDRLLVECEPGLVPVVVGVLQTKVPRELLLKAETIRIEGQREVTILSGRAAMRMRQDGDLELVASRISAASRGFFKLVGRMLRLN